MSNVFTVTTELKLNKEYNQLAGKYISDYIELFNKIQRLTFHRIKNYHIKNGKITQEDRNIIHAQLKEEFNLTSRAIDAILSNMLSRFESIKSLKEFEKKVSEKYKFELLDNGYYSWFTETKHISLEVRVNIVDVEDDFLEMFIVKRQLKPYWFTKFVNWFVPTATGLKDISYFRVKQFSGKDLSKTLLQVLQDLEKYKKSNKLSYLTNLNYSRKA
jgi:hypothetical protein